MTVRVKVPHEFREEHLNVGRVLKKKFPCDRQHLLSRIPITNWLPNYPLANLSYDLIAGLTVALTAIPQGIAYAVIAGLPPQYGLYAEVMPGLVYMLFGSCNYITIGPTAIMALMIQPYVKLSPDFAVLCAFLSGIIIFLFGVLNLGFLVDFVSIPVIVGFTTAAALTISSSQIKSLLGLPGSGNEFIETWTNIVRNIANFTPADAVLGITTILILISLKKIVTLQRWPTVTKYLALSRNAIVVILGTLTAFLLYQSKGEIPFAVTGDVASGLPKPALPPFSTTINGTAVDFPGMLRELGGSLVTIPFVAILEIFAIAKAFAKGKPVDASQEMIALGLCSLSGSFLAGMPVTGSFTRTALNNACNVKTPLGGFFTVALVLGALGLLTQTFYFIPKCVLAGVIIMAVLSMIEYDLIYQIWRTKRLDIIPLTVTLFACLVFGVDYGIIVGIIMNLLFILQKTARPSIKCEIVKQGNRFLLLVTPDQSLFFSSTEHLRNKITKNIHMQDLVEFVVIDGHYIHHLDSTVATGILSLIKDLAYIEKKVILWNWNKEPTGVMYRINSDLEECFMKSESIDEVFSKLPTVTNGV